MSTLADTLGCFANAKGEDARIGTTCAYIPPELFDAAGLPATRLSARGCAGTDIADTYMSRVTCSWTRSVLEAAEEGRYDSLDGFVFTTGCDHMRRLHDNLTYLRRPRFTHILDLPHKAGPEAEAYFRRELADLQARMHEEFGVENDTARLVESIRARNAVRRLITQVDALRSADRLALRASEMLVVTTGLAAMPAAAAAGCLEDLLEQLREAPGADPARARLVLVASQLDDPGYLRVIEAVGAELVGEVACTAASAQQAMVDEEGDPLQALARRYLARVPCPRMMEGFDTLLGEVRRLVAERKADGVVIACLKFCDTWGITGALMARALRDAGVPVLRLEREYQLSGEGQIATRIQAFLESMGR